MRRFSEIAAAAAAHLPLFRAHTNTDEFTTEQGFEFWSTSDHWCAFHRLLGLFEELALNEAEALRRFLLSGRNLVPDQWDHAGNIAAMLFLEGLDTAELVVFMDSPLAPYEKIKVALDALLKHKKP